MSKAKGVKRDYDGYSIWTFESDVYGTIDVMQRDCGDYYEITPCKGVIVNEPHYVSAAGGIPDELRSKFKGKDVVSFSVPVNTTFKFPKLPGEDPIKRLKVWDEIQEEEEKRIFSDYEQAFDKAYDKAVASVKQEKAVLAIKDVNLGTEPSSCGTELNKDNNVVEKGTGSSSDELMKGNSMVEKGTGSSSDELMKGNNVVEKGTRSSSDELMKGNSMVEKGTGSSSDHELMKGNNVVEKGTGSSSGEVIKDNSMEE